MTPFEPKQFGRFYLLEKLAVGGMAEIYKAKTYGAEGFEKLLVIKRILPHCAADKEFISMLIDEAKLSVLLAHANIVQVYDLGKVGDDFFISMEYINGVNLRDILYRCRELERPIPPELAMYTVSEVAKGLDYAHRKTDTHNHPLGIVHRDVSPQNILISFEGEVKIVDFGIAKAAMNISHTMAGILKGKIAYMSPEQALGKPIDYHTDLFSLGIILYECLTGKKLFTGDSQFEVLKKIRSTRITRTNLTEELPLPLRGVLAKTLAYAPKDRYENAGDLQTELTRILYSTYIDFTPQRLAAFVRELFTEELHRQQQAAIARHQREQQTDSVAFFPSGVQEDIVRRPGQTDTALQSPEEVSSPSHHAIPIPPERSLGTIESEPHRVRHRLFTVVGIMAALGAATYASVTWWHPQRTPPPEAVVTQETPEQRNVVPPPAPATGKVHVASEPAGARIVLNGEETPFVTPHTMGHLALHTPLILRLVKEDFLPTEATVTLDGPELRTFRMTLQSVPETAQPRAPGAIVGPMLPDEHRPGTLQPIESPQQQPPTPTTPATATEKGSLRVVTDPPGATIYLNGKALAQRTPATLSDLAVGKSYTIRVAKSGYTGWTRRLTLSSAKVMTLSEPLRKKSEQPATPPPKQPPTQPPAQPRAQPDHPTVGVGRGAITIKSKPKGATVFIDGRAFGRAPLTIQGVNTGPRTVRLVLKGYAPWSQSIVVESGKERYLNVALQRLGE
ncbi:MAG: PEGA domain-containing protein [Deltaproteobacteria bacterium]|nr:PEGA domain-containing protein [Deltaproteobacteria bacterium]